LVEYHVYDVVDFKATLDRRLLPIAAQLLGKNTGSIKIVNTFVIDNEQELHTMFAGFVGQGYEGMMVRNINSVYESKRSYNLQKVKEFEDEEFPILDIIAGKMDTVIFVCETAQGDKFEATMSGDRNSNQRYLRDKRNVIGKQLTVQFQGRTGKNNVPRFPVGKAVRDYE
jgi:DNA ligase-1